VSQDHVDNVKPTVYIERCIGGRVIQREAKAPRLPAPTAG
jgi:hypothetical protein